MQLRCKFGHLLFDILVFVALLFQLLFHLVERLHHLLFLLCLCITFTFFFLKLLLQLMVFCCGEIILISSSFNLDLKSWNARTFPHFLCLLFPLFDLVFIDQPVQQNDNG